MRRPSPPSPAGPPSRTGPPGMVPPSTPAGISPDTQLATGVGGRPAAVQTRPRRDRHGRGLRGPLAPAQVPLSRTRAQQFDEIVDAAVARLERRWGQELAEVEFAVAEVPPPNLPDWAGTPVPLAWLFPAVAEPSPLPPRIVVYRRPLEARAADRRELEALVLDVLVEQVADLLRLEPEAVDPDYGFFED